MKASLNPTAAAETNARNSILGRLRAPAAPAPLPLPDIKAWFEAHQRHEDSAQRVSRLRAALEAVKTEVHDTTAADWPELLLRLVAAKGLRNLLIGSDTPHGAELKARQPENLELKRYAESIDSWRDVLFDEVDASLTLAKSAIAEIGSLILWPTPAEPRLMSLVPSVHFVLLDVATIHSDFYSAMTAEGWKDNLPTNALLICGPSKTADIQQTLAYGAHGPRELVVLLRHAQPLKPGAAA
ncbi:lactate utilization protein [Rhodoferax sp.]|uniref:LutC/YkgG family protein n=1 Tax=Rhodoferax sp. TaxID=50421 RepID=UPI0008C089E4|nr:lactate utilization protein [Rhodoferax sp.]MDO8319749.1 lactate utilization protein [Rhodoferax sp.]MDP2679183.1 lactate utilization protein [Rhodoferax sp.]OGB58933.1 MAG: lactate utilization protein C [Burkholderiales bacterium RIFOXYD12_FULL_59_19]OGB80091.1 MAG: lactate utilization protein C [Burkholderiales bacterium RIFOXYC12_FULL_60_6]